MQDAIPADELRPRLSTTEPLTRSIERTLGDQVIQSVVRMIGDGRLTPGQRLVEAAIARELGVGTVPVREALRVLAGDGVVEIRPNKGAVLRRLSKKELLDTLRAIAALVAVALDALEADKVDGIVPKLHAIEKCAAAATLARDTLSLFRSSADYQREILIAADNRYILRTVDRVHFEFYIRELSGYVSRSALKDLFVPYEAITAALARHDIALAKALYAASARNLEDILA